MKGLGQTLKTRSTNILKSGSIRDRQITLEDRMAKQESAATSGWVNVATKIDGVFAVFCSELGRFKSHSGSRTLVYLLRQGSSSTTLATSAA